MKLHMTRDLFFQLETDNYTFTCDPLSFIATFLGIAGAILLLLNAPQLGTILLLAAIGVLILDQLKDGLFSVLSNNDGDSEINYFVTDKSEGPFGREYSISTYDS